MKILIAEDESIHQAIASKLMNHWGFDFDLASNGLEAIEKAKARDGQYDLCLMDIDMPFMNGLEATAIIRKELKYFPIMALTGNHLLQTAALERGMDDFLGKPYSIQHLQRKINKLTVKALKLSYAQNRVALQKETPMNADQLKELMELDKKDLALLIIESGQQKFVVHKNIQNKMSHVLIGEGKELFEFLDRGDTPANCHLYKCNMQTNRLLLTQEQFEERVKQENSDIDTYGSIADQPFPAENKE
ncbi:MAG: response regulator [Desulfobacterales bacterium]|nr:response regulator [Desulfobacterales bacterium]